MPPYTFRTANEIDVISGLPVVEGERVVGLITASDIFRLMVGSRVLHQVAWEEAETWGLDPRRELMPG